MRSFARHRLPLANAGIVRAAELSPADRRLRGACDMKRSSLYRSTFAAAGSPRRRRLQILAGDGRRMEEERAGIENSAIREFS